MPRVTRLRQFLVAVAILGLFGFALDAERADARPRGGGGGGGHPHASGGARPHFSNRGGNHPRVASHGGGGPHFSARPSRTRVSETPRSFAPRIASRPGFSHPRLGGFAERPRTPGFGPRIVSTTPTERLPRTFGTRPSFGGPGPSVRLPGGLGHPPSVPRGVAGGPGPVRPLLGTAHPQVRIPTLPLATLGAPGGHGPGAGQPTGTRVVRVPTIPTQPIQLGAGGLIHPRLPGPPGNRRPGDRRPPIIIVQRPPSGGGVPVVIGTPVEAPAPVYDPPQPVEAPAPVYDPPQPTQADVPPPPPGPDAPPPPPGPDAPQPTVADNPPQPAPDGNAPPAQSDGSQPAPDPSALPQGQDPGAPQPTVAENPPPPAPDGNAPPAQPDGSQPPPGPVAALPQDPAAGPPPAGQDTAGQPPAPGQPPGAAAGTFVKVAFQPKVTQQDIGTFLKAYNVAITEGPSPEGIYRIQLSDGALPQDQVKQVVDSMLSQTAFVASVTPD